jgi:hypothetical protein
MAVNSDSCLFYGKVLEAADFYRVLIGPAGMKNL